MVVVVLLPLLEARSGPDPPIGPPLLPVSGGNPDVSRGHPDRFGFTPSSLVQPPERFAISLWSSTHRTLGEGPDPAPLSVEIDAQREPVPGSLWRGLRWSGPWLLLRRYCEVHEQ